MCFGVSYKANAAWLNRNVAPEQQMSLHAWIFVDRANIVFHWRIDHHSNFGMSIDIFYYYSSHRTIMCIGILPIE